MIRKIKFILLFSLCCIFIFTGCSSKKYNNDVNSITKDNTYVIKQTADMLLDISDSNEMYKESSYVAIVKIDSITGSDNYSDLNKEYVLPYTYGKMTIVKSLKGNLKENSTVNFYRSGGILEVKKYYSGLSPVQKAKFDSDATKIKELGEAKYIKVEYEEDIDITSGKNYLVYLKSDSYYSGSTNSYAIFGMQGGLREVQDSSNLNSKNSAEIKILNNFTNKWETLDKIVKSVEIK